jgi:hypothetical protein
MQSPEIRRVYRQFTPEERERWLKARAEVEAELPEILARHRVLREAAAEPTLSGALRRAIHRTGLLLPQVAKEVGLSESQIHEFLLGERTLRSDVLDRLARAVGFDLPDDHPPATTQRSTPSVTAAVPPLDPIPAPISTTATT